MSQSYQKHVLKVNVDCEGCRKKVWKLLKKIDGVYSIEIDVESQEVTVSGAVHAATLIKMLNKAGKYAELCFPKMKLQAGLVPDKQNMLVPISIGDGVEDLIGSFRNQSIGMGSSGATTPADLMAMGRIGDVYRDDYRFAGMPPYEVNHQPLMANQQGLYGYFPSAEMNNGYVGNRIGNHDMRFSAANRPEMMMNYDYNLAAGQQPYRYISYQ
ncbi:Heavy metal-associated isoprenylated plant protein 37 [Linum grandiflorum]